MAANGGSSSSGLSRESKLKVSIKRGSRVEQIIVELEFVQSIPKKLSCVLCQSLLREPCVVTCCMASYCRACIDRLSATTGKCGIKKCQKNYAIITSGALVDEIKRKIQQVKVYCFKRAEGCKWSGTIEQLEKSHFNPDEYDEKDTLACQYQEVKCPNKCGVVLPRGKVVEHRFSECDREKTSCQFCGKQFFSRSKQREHQKMCLSIPVECPNGCKTSGISRAEIQNHVYDECPLRQVSCDYRNVGCDKEVRFTDLAKHNMESYQKHLDLMSAQLEYVANENNELQNEKNKLQSEKDELCEENRKLSSEITKLVLMLKEYGHEIDYIAMDSAPAERVDFSLHHKSEDEYYVSCTHLERSGLDTMPEADESVASDDEESLVSYKNAAILVDKKPALNDMSKQDSVVSEDQESIASYQNLKEIEVLDALAEDNQIYEDLDKTRITADSEDADDNDSYDDVVTSGLQAEILKSENQAPDLPPKPDNLKRTRSKRSVASINSHGSGAASPSPSQLSKSEVPSEPSAIAMPNLTSSKTPEYRSSKDNIQSQPPTIRKQKQTSALGKVSLPQIYKGIKKFGKRNNSKDSEQAISKKHEAGKSNNPVNDSSDGRGKKMSWSSIPLLDSDSSMEDEEGYEVVPVKRTSLSKQESTQDENVMPLIDITSPTRVTDSAGYQKKGNEVVTTGNAIVTNSSSHQKNRSTVVTDSDGYQIIQPRGVSPKKKNKQNSSHEEQPTEQRNLHSSSYMISIPSSKNSSSLSSQAPWKVPEVNAKFAEAIRSSTSPINLPQPDILAAPVLPPKSVLSTSDTNPPAAPDLLDQLDDRIVPIDQDNSSRADTASSKPERPPKPQNYSSAKPPSKAKKPAPLHPKPSAILSQTGSKNMNEAEAETDPKIANLPSQGPPPPTAPKPGNRPRLNSGASRSRANSATCRQSGTLPSTLLPPSTNQPSNSSSTLDCPQDNSNRQSMPVFSKVQMLAKQLEQQRLVMPVSTLNQSS